jgi:hypothetical protein
MQIFTIKERYSQGSETISSLYQLSNCSSAMVEISCHIDAINIIGLIAMAS